jgi:hypothetical protein
MRIPVAGGKVTGEHVAVRLLAFGPDTANRED